MLKFHTMQSLIFIINKPLLFHCCQTGLKVPFTKTNQLSKTAPLIPTTLLIKVFEFMSEVYINMIHIFYLHAHLWNCLCQTWSNV